MFISQNGLNFIKEVEGCILQSYDDYNNKIINAGDDVRGTLTIGYGHIENVYKGQVITQEQAEQWLVDDMLRYCNDVQNAIINGVIQFPVNQGMFDALTSFDYNLGDGCLKTLCENRDKATVADKMLLYINEGSVWEEGLLRRRTAERNMFLYDYGVIEYTEITKTIIGEIAQLQNELNNQGFKDSNGNALNVDNIAGELTLSACPTIKKGAKGNITKWLQNYIFNVTADGDFGEITENAVIDFQGRCGLYVDGVIGQNTWREILYLLDFQW